MTRLYDFENLLKIKVWLILLVNFLLAILYMYLYYFNYYFKLEAIYKLNVGIWILLYYILSVGAVWSSGEVI